MPVTAAQLLYANVEKDRSPDRQGGFQTLFYTRSRLTESEVDAIEPRLFYVPGAAAPPKGIAFALGPDKLVLARVVPLEDTDSFGRKGRYLAHALVIDRADWAAGRLDPCAVLRGFPFLTQLDQALAAGDWASGDIAPLTLTQERGSPPARQWPVAALQRLTLYALRAEAMATERRALAFIGPPAEVERMLAEILAAVPAAMGAACSFDSYFNDGNFVATPYWAVGLPEAPPPGRFVRFDLAGGALLDEEPPPAPRTAYERWVVARLADPEPGIEQERETAYALCRWLDGQSPATDLPQEVREPVLAAVFRAAPAQVEARVRECLTQALPAPLAEIVWPEVQPHRADPERYAQLRQGFAPPVLADWLWTRLTRPDARPPAPLARRALTEWVRCHPHSRLGLLSRIWEGQWEALQSELTRLELAEYESLLPPLLRIGGESPLYLLASGRGAAFVRAWLAESDVVPLPIPELVEALIQQQEPAALLPLAPLLDGIRPRERLALGRIIAPHMADIPPDFARSLDLTLAQPNTGGVLGGLARWWQS